MSLDGPMFGKSKNLPWDSNVSDHRPVSSLRPPLSQAYYASVLVFYVVDIAVSGRGFGWRVLRQC